MPNSFCLFAEMFDIDGLLADDFVKQVIDSIKYKYC